MLRTYHVIIYFKESRKNVYLLIIIKKDTLIADTITGNPVVYIVGYKANKYYK